MISSTQLIQYLIEKRTIIQIHLQQENVLSTLFSIFNSLVLSLQLSLSMSLSLFIKKDESVCIFFRHFTPGKSGIFCNRQQQTKQKRYIIAKIYIESMQIFVLCFDGIVINVLNAKVSERARHRIISMDDETLDGS